MLHRLCFSARPTDPSRLRRDLVAAALLLLIPVLVRAPFWAAGVRESPFWAAAGLTLPGADPALPGLPGFLDFEAGWTTQALGTAAAQQWIAGHVPWWDALSGVGMPLAAEMQSSALFLPFILLLLLPAGPVLLQLALQWTAGLATWRLLLRLGPSRGAALAGAALFELSAAFAWMGPPLNLPVAFLPLFLLGIERSRAAALAGRPGGWRLAALALALSLYAGFPETAYLDGLLALGWAVARGWNLGPQRGGYAVRIASGGMVGLLLAAPILWPFLDYLRIAMLGVRDGIDMRVIAQIPAGAAHVLTPYALGLPAGLSDRDPSGLWLTTAWGRAGGYLGMVPALAALLGATAPGPLPWLRRALLAWVVLLLGRMLGVPVLSGLVDLIPFSTHVQVWRYAQAAWQLPCCILAAYALDARAPRWALGFAGLLAGCAAAGLALAWPLASTIPAAPRYMAASGLYAAVSLTLGAAAFATRRRLAAGALLVDAAVLFAVPLAGGARNPRLDADAVAFLQANLGLQRFTTLGPFQPNYGAMFGLASVNHNYLPVPAVWMQHVWSRLQPGADPALFTGTYPPDEPGRPGRGELLKANLGNYAALAVRYVLVPSVADPFRHPLPPGARTARQLGPGVVLSGTLPPLAGSLVAVSVPVGTYLGAAGGMLALRVCDEAACAEGRASIAGALDNAWLEIPLDRPIPAPGPEPALRWTLWQEGGPPAAVWESEGPTGPAPLLSVRTMGQATAPRQVYADALVTVRELADAAPYASVAGGPCRVRIRSRTDIRTECDAPATLVRRELRLPGWRVAVNNTWTEPEPADDLFQAVSLPAGAARVVFAYRPPGFHAFMALFALGVAALLPWHRLAQKRRFPRLPLTGRG